MTGGGKSSTNLKVSPWQEKKEKGRRKSPASQSAHREKKGSGRRIFDRGKKEPTSISAKKAYI